MKEHEKDRTHRTKSDEVYKHNMHGNSSLVRLKDLTDFKVAKDDPDVRGWTVHTSDNMEVGKVDELVVDTNAMKVRYLVVDLYDDYAADKIDHYLLLPIGAARLHDKDNRVMVSGIKTTTILNYPIYRGDDITRDYEYSVRNFYERGGIAPTAGTTTTDRTSLHREDTVTNPDMDRTIVRTDKDHIHGHADATPDVHGTTYRNDIESSHMQNPDRMDDINRADTDSLRGNRPTGERRGTDVGNKPLGTSNRTSATDINERIQTTGLTPRTTNLENKEINQGPSGTHKTEGDAQRPHRQEDEWNDTSNMNSSTSLSNDAKRGSNLGNLENRPQYHTDRERAASPEQASRRSDSGASDEFYDHDHFDEEVFYRVRRRKREE